MRFSSFRTYWISVISLLVMLFTSFASSASASSMQITMQLNGMNGHQMSANVVDCGMSNPTINDHTQHAAPASSDTHNPAKPHCGGEENSAHNCCAATCFTSVALLSPIYQSQQHITQLALIPSERGINVIERSQSLYRPPIA
ncbi:hypothetical protein [Enterovibrio sp. 27052020O]|uniref:hypothetical protein n=1 Tax=Enterovibrio sp. 27052020O TaxID=3241166 RepID=UPI00388DDEE8